MKRMIFSLCLVMLMGFEMDAQAQSLKSILSSSTIKNAVNAITGGQTVSTTNIEGTWTYSNPAVALEGDNVLKNITGSVAATEIEKKVQTYCEKFGLKEGTMSYTFNTDSTFKCLYKGKTINGTYSLNQSDKTITMNFGKLLKQSSVTSITGSVLLSNNQLDLLFNADKMFSLLSKLSSITNNSTLKLANNLASQYKSMKVGFELKK